MSIKLAVWNTPAGRFLISGLRSSPVSSKVEVQEVPETEALTTLLGGGVDVALVTPLEAMLRPDEVDVIPAVSMSTWDYPLARIYMPSGLDEAPAKLVADTRYQQEIFVAGLVLKEHYRMMPEVVEEGDGDCAHLTIGSFDEDEAREGMLALDLGQEWYELTGYPMLWGVFATRKGEATPEVIETIGSLIRTSDTQRALFLQANESSPLVHDFFRDSLRIGFDDLAIASLTELRQYLYYHDVLDEMAELPVVFLPEEDEDEDNENDA
jgi:chorismate dehydratase